MERVSIYKVNYHAPTSTKGARISITEQYTGTRRYYAYDYEIADSTQQAWSIINRLMVWLDTHSGIDLNKPNHKIIGTEMLRDNSAYVVTTWTGGTPTRKEY